MKNTPQVFLISEGADQFAKEQGLNLVDNSISLLKEERLNYSKIKTCSTKR